MAVDNQYVRQGRFHIPLYKDPDLNLANRNRDKWHHLRVNCSAECIWGIPVVQGQYLLLYVEDDEPTDISMRFSGGGQNSVVQLCCIPDGLFSNDPEDCNTIQFSSEQGMTFSNHKLCVRDGQLIQKNYMGVKINTELCGLYYIKILAYDSLSGSLKRIYYSQPIEIFTEQQAIDYRMMKLNIWDECGIGGINWAEGTDAGGQWPFIGQNGGQEIWLDRQIRSSFVEKITNEQVEEDDLGNEVPIFETVDWKYQFDSGYVPDHYAEFLHELAFVSQKSITMRDNTATGHISPSIPNYSDHLVPIKRVETEMLADGDGCYMNVNVKFLINKYNKKSCCAVDECGCPQDDAIDVESYTKDEAVAEVEASLGDVYLVPSGSVGPNWASQQNKLATRTVSGWTYTVPAYRAIYRAKDTGTYYIQISAGVAPLSSDLLLITNKTQADPGTCTWIIEAVIPIGAFAKIQYKIGAGAWTDFTGDYLDSDSWDGGIEISTPQNNTYDLRLVPANTGCNLLNSPEDSVFQSVACI
jgi:hypothetical protein